MINMKTSVALLSILIGLSCSFSCFGQNQNDPVRLESFFEQQSATSTPSEVTLDPFILFCSDEELAELSNTYLKDAQAHASRSPQLHALFLLARKGDTAARAELKQLALSDSQTSAEKGILAYADRAGLLDVENVSSYGVSLGLSVPVILDHIAQDESYRIPQTQNQEMSEAKNVVNRKVLFCSSDELSSLDEDKLHEYVSRGNELVRIHALFLLARRGDTSAIDQVKLLAKGADNGFVRQGAVHVLGVVRKNDDPEILSILKDALNDPFTHFIGDVSVGVGAEAAIQNYGKKAVWTNGNWELKDLQMDEAN